MRVTFLGVVVAVGEGQYSMYVFKNLDEEDNSLLRYFTVTLLPNWECKKLQLGDIGYTECEYVNAGEEYFKSNTGTKDTYNYTACYLLHFIEKQEGLTIKEFNF